MEKIFALKNIPVAFIILASAASSGFAISKLFDKPILNTSPVVEVAENDPEVQGVSTESEDIPVSTNTESVNINNDSSSACIVTLFGKSMM
jgi:hypothetical protein